MEEILKKHCLQYTHSKGNYFYRNFTFIKSKVGYDVIPSVLFVRFMNGMEEMIHIRLCKFTRIEKLEMFINSIK